MKRIFLAALLSIVFPAIAFGACSFRLEGDKSTEYELVWACTTHTDGTLGTITGAGYADQYTGRIDRVKIISGAGLSAGSLKLYSGSDTTDDLLGNLGAVIDTTEGNTLTDSPLTSTNGFVRKVFKESLTPVGAGLGNGGVITLRVLIVRPKP